MIIRSFFPEQHIQRAQAAVALACGHESDDVFAKMAEEPFHDRVLEPGPFDGPKPPAVNDLDAAQPLFERGSNEVINLFLCLGNGAAVQIEKRLD
jgi:hypothetical protein